MTTKYRIHVILIKVDEQDDLGPEQTDIVREEELAGYRDDFKTLDEANKVFDVVSGVYERPNQRKRG